jgi:hypothetical protein
MASYIQEKKHWLKENGLTLLFLLILGFMPFIPVLLTGNSLFASDQIGSPSWHWYFESLRKGILPLWYSLGFGGMPTFDAGMGDAAYPPFVLAGMLLPMSIFVTWMFIFHTLLAGLGAYYFVNRFFNLSRILSLGLGVAYMLNTNFISHIHAGHTGKFHVMAWLPLGLYFLLKSFSPRAHWRYSLGLCIIMVLMLLTNHIQLTYFVLMGFFSIYAFKTFWLLKSKQMSGASLLAFRFWMPILLGLGIAIFMFLPTKKWTENYGLRGSEAKMGYEHATSWSMHPEEAFGLIVPEFSGINERYWGRNSFKLNSEYPGIAILFLGILGLALFRRAKEGWFWLWGGVGLMAIIFGLGAHTFFFRIFYELIPGIKNFRAPSMILFWLATALVVMSADTLSRLSGSGRKVSPDQIKVWDKRLLQMGLGFAGFLLLIGFMPNAFFGFWDALFGGEVSSNLANRVNDQSAFSFGAIKNGVLIAALVFGAHKWLIKENDATRFGLLFLLVTCLDLYSTNANFLKPYDTKATLAKDGVIDFLQNDKSSFRIFGIPGAYQPWRMQYHGIATVDGFTDNEYRIFREYRAGKEGDYHENRNLMAGLKQNADGSVSGSTFLDLLNVKYLVYRDPQSGQLGLAPNSSALPRGWFVPTSEAVSESQALARMKAVDFNPRQLALITDEKSAPKASSPISASASPTPPDSTGDSASMLGEVTMELNGSNSSKWKVKSSVSGLLVLSELWFPHWHVKVDGQEAEVLRVNYAFRGVRVPAGDHIVEYFYQSPWLATCKLISLLSLGLLIVFLFILKVFSNRFEKASNLKAG